MFSPRNPHYQMGDGGKEIYCCFRFIYSGIPFIPGMITFN